MTRSIKTVDLSDEEIELIMNAEPSEESKFYDYEIED